MEIELKGLDLEETMEWALSLGLTPYRAHQIRQWLFKGLIHSFDDMTNLPKPLRASLSQAATIHHLKEIRVLVSRDRTRKYLFQLEDGLLIESVLIPERDHWTLCISSQAGCAMGCRFCLTARQGFKRNLSGAEIVDQVIQVKRSMDEPDRLTNVVFMGMGEPLANYDNVIRALKNLLSNDGLNFSHRRVTLSTCGLAPQMRRLGQDVTVNLAVSLNASDDKTRTRLMPINKIYPLKEVLSACKSFPLPHRRMITFEYILIRQVNDSDQDAQRLVKLLSDLRAKINLIPFNTSPGSELNPSPLESILRFQEILIQNHFTAIIRKSKGQDIMAACGQLSGAFGGDETKCPKV